MAASAVGVAAADKVYTAASESASEDAKVDMAVLMAKDIGLEPQTYLLEGVDWSNHQQIDPTWCAAVGGTPGGKDMFHVPRICCDGGCEHCGSKKCASEALGSMACCAGAIIASARECSASVMPPCHKVPNAATFAQRLHNASKAGSTAATAVAAGYETPAPPADAVPGHHTLDDEMSFFSGDSDLVGWHDGGAVAQPDSDKAPADGESAADVSLFSAEKEEGLRQAWGERGLTVDDIAMLKDLSAAW
jgi:hypothetical protein